MKPKTKAINSQAKAIYTETMANDGEARLVSPETMSKASAANVIDIKAKAFSTETMAKSSETMANDGEAKRKYCLSKKHHQQSKSHRLLIN